MVFTAKDFPTLFPSKVVPRRALRAAAGAAPAERTFSPLAPGTILLCIDPSIAKCGWALVRNTWPNTERLDSGIFHPIGNERRNRHDHLSDLIRQRIELASGAGQAPTDALIEVPSGGQWQHTQALMAYSRSIGVCEATCHRLGLRTHRVNVQTWKGMGKKAFTARVVTHAFKYEPRDSNEADALGLGLWLCGKTKRPTPQESL